MNLHIFHRQAFVFDIVSFKLSGSLEEMHGFVFVFLSLFFSYFRNSGFWNRGFGNYANVYRLNYRLLSANIWCMLLYLENVFFRNAVSEVFYAILNSLLVLGFCCFCVCRILLLKAKKTLFAHCWGYIRKSVFWTTLRSLLRPVFTLLWCEKKTSQSFIPIIAMFQVNHRNGLLALFRCFKHGFYVLGFYWG